MQKDDLQKILNRDSKLASYFISDELAGLWISAIKEHIVHWIYDEEHNKSLWELVRYVSKDRFIASKNRKLTRRIFAEMVFTFCREALTEDETAAKIQSSMEHYEYATKLSVGTVPHEVKGLINDISCFFDGVFENSPEVTEAPTLASRLEDYIRGVVYDSTEYAPFCQIRINPDYGNGVTPTLAIEVYQNQKFLNLNKPSSIVAYKCIDGELDRKSLNDYYVTYRECKNLRKLYIVGSYHLRNDVYQRADDIGVGYVYINPNREMTPDSYELPRTIGDFCSTNKYVGMVLGSIPMQQSLIVCNGQQVTTSLADSLHTLGVAIKKSLELKAPILTFKDIEAMADKLTKPYVDDRITLIYKEYKSLGGHLYKKTNKLENVRKEGKSYVERVSCRHWSNFSIDPFLLAKEEGLDYTYQVLPDNQLGRFDLMEGKIELSDKGLSNLDRLRFTMAHEYGHYKLHKTLLQSQNVQSFGDTEDTITEMITIRDNDRKWFERQANHFASCLLMPKELVGTLYTILFKEFVQDVYGDKLGPIYYNENQPETYATYNTIVNGLAEMLNVSKTAMKLRLERLKFLI